MRPSAGWPVRKGTDMARNGSLVERVLSSLRAQLDGNEYLPGDRLPTETQLAALYDVSRPTVRAALRDLEARGLVRTQHGVGTFVAPRPAVRAGLERLESITDSIRATDREPGMIYKSRIVRPLLPEEAAKLGLPGDADALEVRRSILADGEVVAYSYDLVPLSILPEPIDPEELDGSLFGFLRERFGIIPSHSLAEVHAVNSSHIGWDTTDTHPTLYLLLDQVHFDRDDESLMYSRTYFIEGRYAFTLLRTA